MLDLDVPVRPWTLEQALSIGDPTEMAPIVITGWLPGYADPEYFLRLLFQRDSKTNYGGFSDPEFDQLIERARQERSDRSRLELFHEADRMAVADRIACIPLVYGRSMSFVKPWVRGWWEFGKSVVELRRPGGRPVVAARLRREASGGRLAHRPVIRSRLGISAPRPRYSPRRFRSR